MEIWKPIKGYEGLYQVSNSGQVKSCERICKTGNGLGEHLLPEKILKPCTDKDGYFHIVLCKNSKTKTFSIHRLVATAFIPNPENKPYINHLDCNKQNNNVDNLEWCTAQENTIHASKNSLMKGAENGKKRSKPLIATNITTGEETYFVSIEDACRKLNVNDSNIIKILKNKPHCKTAKGYTFKYAKE